LQTNLLIEKRPEDRDRQEDVNDTLQRFDVVHKRFAETTFGVILKLVKDKNEIQRIF
jgi:hypothetical protein